MKKLTSVLVALTTVFVATAAFAQDGAAASGGSAWKGIAVAICMGLAAAMGTFSQSRAASTALEGIARNPQAAGQVQTPMIIALAMMESLVIFAFIIAILLLNKI